MSPHSPHHSSPRTLSIPVTIRKFQVIDESERKDGTEAVALVGCVARKVSLGNAARVDAVEAEDVKRLGHPGAVPAAPHLRLLFLSIPPFRGGRWERRVNAEAAVGGAGRVDEEAEEALVKPHEHGIRLQLGDVGARHACFPTWLMKRKGRCKGRLSGSNFQLILGGVCAIWFSGPGPHSITQVQMRDLQKILLFLKAKQRYRINL